MSVSSIDQLLRARNRIRSNVCDVQTNKLRCERLCQRIDRLIDPLERLEHASSLVVRTETSVVLERFLACIDDCNQFIERFQPSSQRYEAIVDDALCEDQFEDLNQRLSQLGQDLTVAINVQQLFDRKQDRDDQDDDRKNLHKELEAIAEHVSDLHGQQYQRMDKMIGKHLESFRYFLAKSLLSNDDADRSSRASSAQDHEQVLHIPCKDLSIDSQLLGSGGFADVSKAMWLTHHEQVVVKVLRLHSVTRIRADFYREIGTMYRLRYEHVLTVLGACVEPNFYAIVLEYMPLGSLYDVLHQASARIAFDWSDRYSLAWQMAKSINYLHNYDPLILHRDIKSMNFLLKPNGSSEHKYLLKVCDFGLAEIRRETFVQSAAFAVRELVGSFSWKAPELFVPHARHSKQTDVYSLGMVLWELATGRKPWDEYADEAIVLIQLKTGVRPTIPLDVPEGYRKSIESAWHHCPEQRPSCFQLMEHMLLAIDSQTSERQTERSKSVISNINTEYDGFVDDSAALA